MRKKTFFAYMLAALFLGAQLFVAQHDASFGPEKHQHAGHACAVQLFAEHAKAPSLPSLPAVPAPQVLAAAETAIAAQAIAGRTIRSAQPRAPPISLV